MKLVTLATVQLNRLGSASRVAFGTTRQLSEVREVKDAEIESLKAAVIHMAELHGEPPANLAAMREVNRYRAGLPQGQIGFDIPEVNVMYSEPYAVCYAYPALKIGDRYFKLDEVTMR